CVTCTEWMPDSLSERYAQPYFFSCLIRQRGVTEDVIESCKSIPSLRPLIMEYLVKIRKKARILELKRRHLKILTLTSYTSSGYSQMDKTKAKMIKPSTGLKEHKKKKPRVNQIHPPRTPSLLEELCGTSGIIAGHIGNPKQFHWLMRREGNLRKKDG
nr:hypothetical protein [Tanacetum cinerariifolium]